MNLIKNLFVFAAVIALVACGSEEQQTEKASLDDASVIALVDGHAITTTDRRLHLQQRQQQGQTADINQITEELVNLKVIVLNAEKEGFHLREDVAAEIKRQRNAVIANTYIQEKMQSIEVTDDDLKAEFKQQIEQLPNDEFSASHILLETEEAALASIKRLEAGDEFGRVASEESTGPSAENGGELGWFRPEAMVPEFSEAVAKLEKGEYTKEPVKTRFGWHVIRLTDTRPIVQPEFDTVKEQIRTIVVNNNLNDLVQGLRKESEIEIKQP